MMALYMPMQPSSKMPMMAFSRASRWARALPRFRSAEGILTFLSGVTCLVGCRTSPLRSQRCRPSTKNSSVKSSLQSVEYFFPALVSEAFRLSMPTRPGHVPDQLATVRIGPLCESSPARTWCEYCQTASATISLASGSMPANTHRPSFCEPMKPCFSSSLYGWARTSS